ncbi:kinesin-like protein KIF6 [Engraulis encrasicolus]|uniref:kinesin-like protein KIF6 n=1 Tax=Engraulis encrasicolus TaxID=184585 RepID=UPI002FD44292
MLKQAIQIYARVKPSKKQVALYSVDGDGSSLDFEIPKDLADGFVNNKKDKYRFRFQKIFDQACKQDEIFDTVAKPIINSVLDGYNGTIFAYGQTGSGKTFTITGGAERYADRGVIPRTLSYLYQHFTQDSSKIYTTHISYLEIYNETGYDLLDPRQEASSLEDLPKVTIHEDTDQNIHLKNLSVLQSANEEEALNLLFLGDTNRIISETPMNQTSTRSHCIFTIHVCSRQQGSATVRQSKLHLVDLAGSERVGKTGVGGHTLTEAKYINLSLHFLEQVIIALSEKNRSHIPYRNSLMTSVLRDSLGGNCMTTMIATISVETRNLDESISTCRFSQRVAMIKNEALLNEELDPALQIVCLKREIQTLKDELSLLTGEQRGDELNPQETQRLQEQVRVFVDDPDPEVELSLGPDMKKINYCFCMLKAMIREGPSSSSRRSGDSSARQHEAEADQVKGPSPTELKRLKAMLLQRDSEISILVSMLKREKKRAQDAVARLSLTSMNQLPTSPPPPSLLPPPQGSPAPATYTHLPNTSTHLDTSATTHLPSTSTHLNDSATHLDNSHLHTHAPAHTSTHVSSTSTSHLGDAVTPVSSMSSHLSTSSTHLSSTTTSSSHLDDSPRGRGRGAREAHHAQRRLKMQEFSAGQQEAFEIFRRDHDDRLVIEQHKTILKQRYAEAKALGLKVNNIRSKVNDLKKQLELRRKQVAVQGMTEDSAASKDPDPVEQRLLADIKEEKSHYKTCFGRLKGLKTEIEHLQLLLDKTKVKILMDFQEWWSQEAHRTQGSQEAHRTQRQKSDVSPAALVSSTHVTTPPVTSGLSSVRRETSTSASPLPLSKDYNHTRALSSTNLSESSVPLTGDEKVDADILAFFKARQSLLNRTGLSREEK